jgi:hypothetical protein
MLRLKVPLKSSQLDELTWHVQVVDQLLDLQFQRMKLIQEEFERKLQAMEDEFSAERSDIAAAHAKHKKDMNDIVVAMQAQFAELESELRQVRAFTSFDRNCNVSMSDTVTLFTQISTWEGTTLAPEAGIQSFSLVLSNERFRSCAL